MKTTIDIADGLLAEVRERAARERTTLRALVERGLREVLNAPEVRAEWGYEPVTAELEPAPGVDLSDWSQVKRLVSDEEIEARGGAGDNRLGTS